MGILNVTPDSFSDGGRFLDLHSAVEHARRMEAEGADLIDVGGESTRPGSAAVSESAELARVVPVIRAVRRAVRIPLSIDTTKAAVAAAALDEGAELVNDVTAGRGDRRMLEVVAARGASVVLMHMKGRPRTMQRRPRYRNVVREVGDFLERQRDRAVAAGVRKEAIAIDPGIGFGKTLDHNLRLLRDVAALATLGQPVVIGVSRKSFLATLLGLAVDERLEASIAAALVAVLGGAQMVRVHDVGPTVRSLRLVTAIREAGGR
jgi:dihydropteroate synthase